jgi:hypothetical protein
MSNGSSRVVKRPQDDHDQHPCGVDRCTLHDDAHDFDETWSVQGRYPSRLGLPRLQPYLGDNKACGQNILRQVNRERGVQKRPGCDSER